MPAASAQGIDMIPAISLARRAAIGLLAGLALLVAAPVQADPPPPLNRFADRDGKPPRPPFPNGRFTLEDDDTVIFVGQENCVREQKAGELEAILAQHFAKQKPHFRSMAWEGDTVYKQWRDLNFGPWADQLAWAGAGVVICQFGQVEALDGPARLDE